MILMGECILLVEKIANLEVLIATPNLQVAQGIQNMLVQHKVLGSKTAANSREAVQAMANSTRFNLFFVSQDLPDQGGIDFCRFIRLTNTGMAKADLILHISNPTKAMVLEARSAGINKIMVGNLSGKAVFDQIKDVLKNRRPFIEADTYCGPDRRRANAPLFTGVDRRK